MAPVQQDLNCVPILMTGEKAPQLANDLKPFGMNVEIVDGPTGTAAAIKMCRSIVIKGLEALLLECMVTARHFGCTDAVLHSLSSSNPEINWNSLSNYMIGRVREHGVRRAAEMDEVVRMQRTAGLPARMSIATAEVQNWKHHLSNIDIRTNAELLSALTGIAK
jgi:3-hydroxyisobutyrate dehydrogenase-like beta-hydroxyacid dehydrogenase